MVTNFAKFGLIFFLSISGLKAQAQTTKTQVDLNQVNTVIQEIIDSSITPDEVIKSVGLIISPASDIKEGKVAVQFTSVFGTAPWAANQDGRLNLAFGTRFSEVNAGYKNADIKVKVQIKTPLLGMIRYFAAKNLESKSSDDTAFNAVTSRKLAAVKNLNELLEIASSIREYYIQNADQQVKEFLESIQVTTKVVDGNVTSFKLQALKPLVFDFYEKIEIKAPTVTVNANSIATAVTVGLMVKENDFNDFVAKTEEFMLNVQERNQEVLNSIKSDVAGWADLVRDFLTK